MTNKTEIQDENSKTLTPSDKKDEQQKVCKGTVYNEGADITEKLAQTVPQTVAQAVAQSNAHSDGEGNEFSKSSNEQQPHIKQTAVKIDTININVEINKKEDNDTLHTKPTQSGADFQNTAAQGNWAASGLNRAKHSDDKQISNYAIVIISALIIVALLFLYYQKQPKSAVHASKEMTSKSTLEVKLNKEQEKKHNLAEEAYKKGRFNEAYKLSKEINAEINKEQEKKRKSAEEALNKAKFGEACKNKETNTEKK